MNVTLRPDRALLDASFESYKLSADKIPSFNFSVSQKIDFHSLETSLSKQHIQAYSHQNCLTPDPFVTGDVYYWTTDGMIYRLRIPDNPNNLRPGTMVHALHGWSEGDKDRLAHGTLKFPTDSLGIMYDGRSHLFIFKTDRTNSDPIAPWKLHYTCQPPLMSRQAQLLDAVGTDGGNQLHLILAAIGKRPDEFPIRTKSSFVTYLEWMTYSRTDTGEDWTLFQHRRLVGCSFPDYVTFNEDATSIHICAEKQFHAIYDSKDATVASRAFEQEETDMVLSSSRTSLMSTTSDVSKELTATTTSVPIQWTQSDPTASDESGMIHITFELSTAQQLPNSKKSEAVRITVNPTQAVEDQAQTLHVELTHTTDDVTEKTILINNALFGYVESSPMWTVDRENKLLEIHLPKKHTLHWSRLFRDVAENQELLQHHKENFSASEVEHIQDAPKPTEDGATNGDAMKPAFNVEQLEDVDFPLDDDEDDLMLQRFDAQGLRLTHLAGLSGHQWLLNVPYERKGAWPSSYAICLRHDVDGCVWEPCDSTTAPWSHIATLQAFGYVLASKRDHRFVSTPCLVRGQPISFVAVADAVKRIFVYRQPVIHTAFPQGDMELRRRKTEKTENGATAKTPGVVHVAWQHVVNIPEDDPIVGFVTLEKPYAACVACTQNKVYLFSLTG